MTKQEFSIAIKSIKSSRRGTQLWAINGLVLRIMSDSGCDILMAEALVRRCRTLGTSKAAATEGLNPDFISLLQEFV